MAPRSKPWRKVAKGKAPWAGLVAMGGIDWYWMDVGVPSGYVKIAIENDHRNSEFYHKKLGGSFHSFLLTFTRGIKNRVNC